MMKSLGFSELDPVFKVTAGHKWSSLSKNLLVTLCELLVENYAEKNSG